MGEHSVSKEPGERLARSFMRGLLEDVVALESLLSTDRIERGVRRIGAEQEMFLVDKNLDPAPRSMEILASSAEPRLTTELARFNLEANLSPRLFGGSCLGDMEVELAELIASAQRAAETLDADVLLTGILPTLRRSDLTLDNMTPSPRYRELNRALTELRGGDFHVGIKGIDELEMAHDNVMLEACNTSFQVHFQVAPEEFAHLYNVAQLVTAPVLAAAANSPVLMRRRLWHETRIALFERSVDTRSVHRQQVGNRPRVHFGDDWLKEGVLEIFREDIARFRPVIAVPLHEDSQAVVRAGGIPELSALRLHNGTIYRWNRACYGRTSEIAHLRIENRVIPAGPTVLDEMANAAFFFGLMAQLSQTIGRIDTVMRFDAVRSNFFSAARLGLHAQFEWLDGRAVAAPELILNELIPRAREGLEGSGIQLEHIQRYLGIIEGRVREGQTGAVWILRSLDRLGKQGPPDLRYRVLTAAMLEHQDSGKAVHSWPLAEMPTGADGWRSSFETVGQIMSTDLFTVRPDDIVDLAASVMDWRHIRHVPVEDKDGRLVGLISHRALLRMVARGQGRGTEDAPQVKEVMRQNPITVGPSTLTLDAIDLMRRHQVGCLPVVEGDKLVGIITERDLIDVSAKLLEDYLRR